MKSCPIFWPQRLGRFNLLLLGGLLFLLGSCAGRPYRPESIAAKMQRYEGQQTRVAINQWQIDQGYFTHNRRPSAEAGAGPKVEITKPLIQIYFLSLVEQYYQLGQFLPETTPPLKICANFHDVLVREALYPPPAKKSLVLPSQALMAQHQFLYPISQLPLEADLEIFGQGDVSAGPMPFKTILSVKEAVPSAQNDTNLLQAAHHALRGQQARIYAEIWQLCDTESGRSVNSDNFLNLVSFKDQHPLTPSAEHVAVLFKIFPISNWALLDSLPSAMPVGIYTGQVLQSLEASWFKEYLHAQKVQRGLASHHADFP